MIKSIRWRLFAGITALIMFFVVLSWFLNTMYLGKYYTYQKKGHLIKTYEMINRIYKDDPLSIELQLEKTGRTTGINIAIISKDFEPLFNSFPGFRNRFRNFQLDQISQYLINNLQNVSGDQYFIITSRDMRLNTNFLYLGSRLTNGDFLILSTPLIAIRQNVEITNKFSMYTGILTIIIGLIAIYFFTRRFTRPIMALNEIALRMSKLDFSSKYAVKTEDEIGELGKSINSLSDQLDHSITELQEANLKLQEDIERERKIDEMRKEFISSASHELKTPIALIQGYAEGLKVNVNEDEENKNFYCEVIMNEAKKMDQLTKDLLDLSLIESGHFKLEKITFDVSALIDHIINKYSLIFKEKNIDLSVEKGQHILVHGDNVKIEQVLVNYLNNAINHLDENNIVRIKIIEGDQVRIAFFNSGKRIPEESLDMIWKSFYKVDKARTRAHGGTGLGLSIVRAIMELHQNSYGVNNQDGGVEFWIELDRTKVPVLS